MVDLSVVITSWNTRELRRECLAALTKYQRPKTSDELPSSFVLGHSSEVIVIDNASADGNAEMVQREFPDVRLIVNEGNLGFYAGKQSRHRGELWTVCAAAEQRHRGISGHAEDAGRLHGRAL